MPEPSRCPEDTMVPRGESKLARTRERRAGKIG